MLSYRAPSLPVGSPLAGVARRPRGPGSARAPGGAGVEGLFTVLHQVVDEGGHGLDDLVHGRGVTAGGAGVGGGSGPGGEVPSVVARAHHCTVRSGPERGIRSPYVSRGAGAAVPTPRAAASWWRPSIISFRYTRLRWVSTVRTDR